MKKNKAPKRFALTETYTRPGYWTITDTYTGIGVTFKAHAFATAQEINLPDGGQGLTAEDIAEVPAVLDDITEWLMRFNYDLCAPTTQGEREAMGRRIRQMRTAAGLTVEDLARKAGVSAPNICRIEAGRYAFNFDSLAHIAYALNKKLDFVDSQN